MFDENGHMPYSEDLDSIIQDFQVSGVINKLNPGFNTVIINKSEEENVLKKFNQKLPEIKTSEVEEISSQMDL